MAGTIPYIQSEEKTKTMEKNIFEAFHPKSWNGWENATVRMTVISRV